MQFDERQVLIPICNDDSSYSYSADVAAVVIMLNRHQTTCQFDKLST